MFLWNLSAYTGGPKKETATELSSNIKVSLEFYKLVLNILCVGSLWRHQSLLDFLCYRGGE